MKSASLLLVGNGWPDLRICWPLPYLLIGLSSGCCWAVGSDRVRCLVPDRAGSDRAGLLDQAGQYRAEAIAGDGRAHTRAYLI